MKKKRLSEIRENAQNLNNLIDDFTLLEIYILKDFYARDSYPNIVVSVQEKN